MVHKAWNVRDQTEKELEDLLTKKYRQIEGSYKLLRKISTIEDAKMIVDEIWSMKRFCNQIELELTRRSFNEAPKQNEGW